jgi:hypothetical protein
MLELQMEQLSYQFLRVVQHAVRVNVVGHKGLICHGYGGLPAQAEIEVPVRDDREALVEPSDAPGQLGVHQDA